jgi:hypothetical protein
LAALKVGAIPPLARGLIENRKRDLLHCARGGLGRSCQAGKGHNLLTVGRLGKTDNRLGGGLMDTCEQGQHDPRYARGSAAASEQIFNVSFHRELESHLLLQSEKQIPRRRCNGDALVRAVVGPL